MPLGCSEGGIQAYLEQWRILDAMLRASLDIAAEQALDPASRVRLGHERDRFELRRIELDWRFSEVDFDTGWTATVAFGERLAERDVGRLELANWPLDPSRIFPGPDEARVGGPHHMCTTRLSEDPKRGVVDRNCRVHGMEVDLVPVMDQGRLVERDHHVELLAKDGLQATLWREQADATGRWPADQRVGANPPLAT